MTSHHFTKIRRRFDCLAIADIEQAVARELNSGKLQIPPGARIAIAAGSRGVANIARITRAVVDIVRARGGEPFVFPAMGSHGGATAEGQCRILASYGIDEAKMGCPILSSMEVVQLDDGGPELPLFMDRCAWESDGVILINRIKPHTAFHGEYESGLVKMSVIGLGKERLASEIHSYGIWGLKTLLPQAGRQMLSTGKILLGLGIVENACDQTAIIEALTPAEILAREPELLNAAKRMLPHFPLDEFDVLVVDRMGKDISGSGMDPNIIGRLRIPGEPEPELPRIKSIVVTDLTEGSHGNACGVGLADVTTRRLLDKVDWDATYTNGVTSGIYSHFSLPMVAATDAQALEWGIHACHKPRQPKKIVRIADTLHLSEMYVSDAVLQEINERVEILGDPSPMFEDQGSLIAF
ncbi:MAG: hypothetical protein KIT57_08855 [Blastocatellales bacterium]|nr:hypothetical protein [Blastocatellales bacterium]